jgi:hypothetical protein
LRRRDACCAECQTSRNCGSHWQYLLSTQAWLAHLQSPGCGHVWTTDTRWRRDAGHRQPPVTAA